MFLFTAKSDSGTNARIRDTITDFSQKGGDKIDLGRIGLDKGNGEDPFFTFLGKGAFTGKAGELRYEIKDGKTTVLSDLDGDGDGDADVSILLDGTINLKATDFILLRREAVAMRERVETLAISCRLVWARERPKASAREEMVLTSVSMFPASGTTPSSRPAMNRSISNPPASAQVKMV
ncbi:MAG: hypothetical protein DI537_52415 [Stutzerimonas stutzeri]|uniref:hypothetical protein n=1 Tax=Shinella sp. JR1-6 TaxID=2527671 RepID=UPI000DB57B58|nr:hypothetical protein [Shinella sp. JR1-6]PZR61654.1 MAG: hypothetical protein DI537_52415 [Stutzerimonas stutzeri]TAA60863.1 hypothetical protein EXZ48_13875 [Shinella sp. JR1-6]